MIVRVKEGLGGWRLRGIFESVKVVKLERVYGS